MNEGLTAHFHKKGQVVLNRYEIWSKGDATGKKFKLELQKMLGYKI